MSRSASTKREYVGGPSHAGMLRRRLAVYGLIIIFAALGAYMLWLYGESVRVGPFIGARKHKLESWRTLVNSFVNENGKLPDTLYEAAMLETEGYVYPYVSSEAVPLEEYDALIKDRTLFLQKLQYELVKRQKGWFVIELEVDDYYPHILMIEQGGRVYSLRKPSLAFMK